MIQQILSPELHAELAERLIGSLRRKHFTRGTAARFTEVKRRVAEVESGEAQLIPGDEVLALARRLLASAQRTG